MRVLVDHALDCLEGARHGRAVHNVGVAGQLLLPLLVVLGLALVARLLLAVRRLLLGDALPLNVLDVGVEDVALRDGVVEALAGWGLGDGRTLPIRIVELYLPQKECEGWLVSSS